MSLQALLAFAGEHALLSLALVGITLALVYTEIARLFSGFKAVNPAGLTELINREDALLLDLSAAGDFEKGHIPGARNVPPGQFDPQSKMLAKAQERPVALACRSGTASAEAAKKLVKAGFKRVVWLDGGVLAWQAANLPLARGRG